MIVVDFEGWQAFYDFLKGHHQHFGDASNPDHKLAPFINKVKLIDKGCSCGKNKRIQNCKIEYMSIGSVITPEIKDKIKLITQSDKVILYNDGSKFLEF